MKFITVILLSSVIYGQKVVLVPLSLLSVAVHARENCALNGEDWHKWQDADRYLTIMVGVAIGFDAKADKEWYIVGARILADIALYNSFHGLLHKPFMNLHNGRPFWEEKYTSSYYNYGSKELNSIWFRIGFVGLAILINYLVYEL